jgi:hypothetical protein
MKRARAAIQRRRGLYAALVASCASGCIEGILVEDQRGAVTLADGQAPMEEDADLGEPELDAAAGPGPVDAGIPGPLLDAGAAPPPRPDAGQAAGRDAAGAPSDAGANQDSSCASGRCDAGGPVLGPCAACGPVTLVGGPAVSTDFVADCGNGAPKVCWSNPDGTCDMQCPNTESCSKDDPDACGAGRYCYFPYADCGANSPGFCAPAPNECMNVVARVCGCDGRVYQNPCFAARDGGTAAYHGLPEENCK